MPPVASLGVGDGLLERQPGAVLGCLLEVLVAQRGAGVGELPLGSLPGGREGHEPEDGPLLAGGRDQPDGPVTLPSVQSDLSEEVEGVDDRRTPSVIHEDLECVVDDGFRALVVALQEHGASQPEVGDCLGARVPQGLGGGQEHFHVDLGPCAVAAGECDGYQDRLGVPAGVAKPRFQLIEARGPLCCLIEIVGRQGGDAQGVHECPCPKQ
jgi:hypothetical protein